MGCVDPSARIELTLRLWSRGAPETFEEYVDEMLALLPRNRGVLERRAHEIEGPGAPDAVLVMSFPDSASVDGFLRDPLRVDMEDLAASAISRSRITDSRHRREVDPGNEAEVVSLRPDPPDAE